MASGGSIQAAVDAALHRLLGGMASQPVRTHRGSSSGSGTSTSSGTGDGNPTTGADVSGSTASNSNSNSNSDATTTTAAITGGHPRTLSDASVGAALLVPTTSLRAAGGGGVAGLVAPVAAEGTGAIGDASASAAVAVEGEGCEEDDNKDDKDSESVLTAPETGSVVLGGGNTINITTSTSSSSGAYISSILGDMPWYGQASEAEIEALRRRGRTPLHVRLSVLDQLPPSLSYYYYSSPSSSSSSHYYCITLGSRPSQCVRCLRDLRLWRDVVVSPSRADLVVIQDEALLGAMRGDAGLEAAVLAQIATWYDLLKAVPVPVPVPVQHPGPLSGANTTSTTSTTSTTTTSTTTSVCDLRSEVGEEVLDAQAVEALKCTSSSSSSSGARATSQTPAFLLKQIELMRVLLSARVGVANTIINILLGQSNFLVNAATATRAGTGTDAKTRRSAITNNEIPFTPEVCVCSYMYIYMCVHSVLPCVCDYYLTNYFYMYIWNAGARRLRVQPGCVE